MMDLDTTSLYEDKRSKMRDAVNTSGGKRNTSMSQEVQ